MTSAAIAAALSTAPQLPALHDAVFRGDLAAVTALVTDQSCDVNECTEQGSTPLLLAATCGHTEITSFLLSKGAAVNQYRPSDRTTPLCAAVAAGRLDVTRVLLQHGADQSIARISGATPLYLAAAVESSDKRTANPAMVELLRHPPPLSNRSSE